MVVYRVTTSSGIMSVKAPVSWEETPTGLFEELYRNQVSKEDPLKTFSVITGLTVDEIAESNDRDLEAGLYQVNAYVFNQPETFRNLEVPERIKLRGNWITIPKNKIDKYTISQGLAMRQEIRKAVNLESLISFAIAVYLQPVVDGQAFDLAAARELRKEIQELPIFATFPLGFFLLAKHAKAGRNGSGAWLRRQAQRISSALRLQSWPTLKSSSRSGRYQSSRPTQKTSGSSRAWSSKSPWTRSSPTLSFGSSVMNTTSDTRRPEKN